MTGGNDWPRSASAARFKCSVRAAGRAARRAEIQPSNSADCSVGSEAGGMRVSWSVPYLTESRPLLLSHPAWPSSIPKMEALLCCAAPWVRGPGGLNLSQPGFSCAKRTVVSWQI